MPISKWREFLKITNERKNISEKAPMDDRELTTKDELMDYGEMEQHGWEEWMGIRSDIQEEELDELLEITDYSDITPEEEFVDYENITLEEEFMDYGEMEQHRWEEWMSIRSGIQEEELDEFLEITDKGRIMPEKGFIDYEGMEHRPPETTRETYIQRLNTELAANHYTLTPKLSEALHSLHSHTGKELSLKEIFELSKNPPADSICKECLQQISKECCRQELASILQMDAFIEPIS